MLQQQTACWTRCVCGGWGGGLKRKSEACSECWGRWGPLTLTQPLSPGHLLGLHNGSETECECVRSWGWRVLVLDEEGGGHSVTFQPSSPQSHPRPGRAEPSQRTGGCRRSVTPGRIYSSDDSLHFPHSHSGLLLWKIIHVTTTE